MSNSQPTLPQHQLNYHARKRGRHAKTHKYQVSPLHHQQPNTITITSRSRTNSKTSHPDSLSNSVIWLNQIPSQDPHQILILEEQEQPEMLILNNSDQNQTPSSQQLTEQIASKKHSSGYGCSGKTSILICEQSEDLVWINKQQYCEQHLPYIQHSPNKSSLNKQSILANQLPHYFRVSHGRVLSNIQEMSSQAEEDREESRQEQFLGRAPISPQTQPLLKLKPVVNQNCNTATSNKQVDKHISSQNCIGNSKKEELMKKKRLRLGHTIIKDLSVQQKSNIFEQQIEQLHQIAQQTHQQNRHNVQQIIHILQQEQEQLQQQINQQHNLLLQLKCSIHLAQPIKHPQLIHSHLSQQEQIRLNINMIRRVVTLATRP